MRPTHLAGFVLATVAGRHGQTTPNFTRRLGLFPDNRTVAKGNRTPFLPLRRRNRAKRHEILQSLPTRLDERWRLEILHQGIRSVTTIRRTPCRANGIRQFYFEAEAGAPVVLLHGLPETNFAWRFQIPARKPITRASVLHAARAQPQSRQLTSHFPLSGTSDRPMAGSSGCLPTRPRHWDPARD